MGPAIELHDVLVAHNYAAGRAAIWRDSDGDLWLTDDLPQKDVRRLSEAIDHTGEAAIEIEDHQTQYVLLGGVLPSAAASVRVQGFDGINHIAECGNGCWVVAFPDECGVPLKPEYLDRQGNPL